MVQTCTANKLVVIRIDNAFVWIIEPVSAVVASLQDFTWWNCVCHLRSTCNINTSYNQLVLTNFDQHYMYNLTFSCHIVSLLQKGHTYSFAYPWMLCPRGIPYLFTVTGDWMNEPATILPDDLTRHLRSAESGCLAVTGTMTNLGSRYFAVDGAKVCNSLPVDLRLLSRSLRTLGHKLKHYLFMSEPWAHLRFFKVALYKFSHYYYITSFLCHLAKHDFSAHIFKCEKIVRWPCYNLCNFANVKVNQTVLGVET